jgi:hypothetical protein
MAGKSKPLPYEAGKPANWDTGVKGFRFNKESLTLSGDCPRCHHAFARDLTDRIVNGSAPRPDGTIDYLWECTCEFAHPGVPAGSTGCGAKGPVRILP